MNDYWSRFLSALRGEQRQPTEDEKRVAECWSSGALSTGNLLPFDYSPAYTPNVPTLTYGYNHHSATGEVYALKEAVRALLAEVDSQPTSTMLVWLHDDGVVERVRKLVEPE